MINVNATAEHLRIASEDDNTAVILWSGHGNAEGFFLVSDAWSIEDGKVLSTPVQGVTCTANGQQYSLMNAEARTKYTGYNYASLSDCKAQLKAIEGGACKEFTTVDECL
ncbi:MAG: hypothetical protein H7177_04205 [Rhizobacter sp.]|nr:hypothetical protein [Bacteriovorax sp.]